MKVLVTGCAGFIGSKVSELLLNAGYCVIGVDNLNSSYDVNLKEWRLSQLNSEPNFTFSLMDVVERKDLAHLFDNQPWDAVINLAARVTDYPLSPYAASKKAVEGLCHSYHHNAGIDITMLRYFTVFGPAGRPDMSIFRFIKWICEKEQLVLYGDGSQERDFTYVDDIARGTVLALKSVGFEAVNLGSDRPVPLNDVIALLQEILEEKAIIDFRSAHQADVRRTWADISKAQELLGWKPEVTLEEGLRRSVNWYFEHRTWASQICV